MELRGKKAAILGMAQTGIETARVLRERSVEVVLYDAKNPSALGDSPSIAEEIGAKTVYGYNGSDSFGDVDFVIVSPGVPFEMPALLEAETRGIPVMAEIELAYRISPAPIIAITGTNGKSTTTVMAGKMMAAGGKHTLIGGNIAAEGYKMALITAAHLARPDSVIVAEVSSFQLERIIDFRPKVAALLNISVDHLDRHPDFQAYANIKGRIFSNQQVGDWAIVNADNEPSLAQAPINGPRVLKFSTKIEPEDGAFIRDGMVITRIDGKEKEILPASEIPLPGTINQENVLAACCVAEAMGVESESMARAVRETVPLPHRMNTVANIDGVKYIDNSMCTNVEAAIGSIESLKEPLIVIAGGKFKGGDIEKLASCFVNRAKHLVLIGASATDFEEAVRSKGYEKLTVCGSLESAVYKAKEEAKSGDVVLLAPACASFDMFKDFIDRGKQFQAIVAKLNKD